MCSRMKERKSDDVFYLIPDEKRKGNSSVILWLFVFVGFALFFVSSAAWYHRTLFHVASYGKSDLTPVCRGISDLNKFDCHPEDNPSEESCLQRGCCYQAKIENFPPLNIPYCFYPSNYDGYSVGNITQDGRHIKADLERSSPSGFPKDALSLHLIIFFIDDCTLRVKITDAKATRFEVPIPINDSLRSLEKPCYDVKIDSKAGQLLVTRKTSGTVIFKTNLSQMVYSDQFLQLSSYLPSPYIYGIGEHYGSFLKSVNWTRLTLFNTDHEPGPNYPLYGSQPFYLSLEEDGNANGVFLFNSNAMDVILQPTPAITFRPIGGVLDFFIMLGPSPANVVQQFTEIVGRTFMPPYWSLGFHLCRYGYTSLNKTKETLQRNLDAGIPVAVQWNDIDYMDKFKDFTYDQELFAGLPDFVEDLHSKGMHYVIMTDPGISSSERPGTYPPYDDGLSEDIFMKNPNGSLFEGKVWTDGGTVFPDFSHPNSTAYWLKQLSDFHSKVQFDGVWIDMNEPSNVIDGGIDGCIESSFEDPPYLPNGNYPLRHRTACMTAKHYATIHYNEHNLLGFREASATSLAMKSIRQKRPFVISRATFSGQGPQSGHWSGDISSTWEDMRYTIPSMLSFNLYGVSMVGSDICGFNFNTTVPLCARWQSLGAFYPFSRNHNDASAVDQDPAVLGPDVIEATKNSLHFRYMLLPYLYTLFARSHLFGDTVVRSLFFEFPHDPNTYAIDEQFLWGPGLMVVPAIYPDTERVDAYFPAGKWYGVNEQPINSTGQKISLQVPLTNICLAYRGGYILPLQNKEHTMTREVSFTLFAALDENFQASGELYWDDGDSLDAFEKGSYSHVQFSAKKGTLTSTLAHNGYEARMELSLIGIVGLSENITQVTVNSVHCKRSVTWNEEHEMDLFDHPKMLEKFHEVSSESPTCIYGTSLLKEYLIIFVSGTDLHSPLTVTWK